MSANDLTPGTWLMETRPYGRRLLVHAIHRKPGLPVPNVELLVDGLEHQRLSLSLHTVRDPARFKPVQG